jgi:hypothetical protein
MNRACKKSLCGGTFDGCLFRCHKTIFFNIQLIALGSSNVFPMTSGLGFESLQRSYQHIQITFDFQYTLEMAFIAYIMALF